MLNRCCLVAAVVAVSASTYAGELLQEDGGTAVLPNLGDSLNDQQVVKFAQLALRGIRTEYPNKPSNVMQDASGVLSPREMHPAFFGCFDWHSSVHGHWMLVRILHKFPACSISHEIRATLDASLNAENLRQETAYFQKPENRNFERMYGWAWLLRLITELEQWQDPQGNRWRENLRPLEDEIVNKAVDYLPLLSFPIRTGVHPDTGFALAQYLDYARQTKNVELEKLLVRRSLDYYQADRDYPFRYEPSGEDFFSSGLNEADLMRRVLDQAEFVQWLDRFMPQKASLAQLLAPVEVSDVTDGKIVHLAGLDLSRAWCFQGIASALPAADSRREFLKKAAYEHAQAGYKYVFSGHYEGEHWLATFAIYLHTNVGVQSDK
jgi:hypothetical protein